ncbi:MAG: Alpha-pyrone synthesis polyketide synthase-like Pks18 [Gemmataceae bacterium]|nr:Alpha-pyrone synthesis polyketide synthase-like Pks18 [Gemmataceae bacterium]
MSFVIHGLGTALPPGRVTQEEAAACARVLAGPAIRDASWLPAVYAHSGIRTRHQILGRALVDDLMGGTEESGSPFLPRADRAGGPSTGERMRIYAAEAGPLAVRAAAGAVAEAGFDPLSFTHLVTVSCTGFVAPGVDLALIRGLGLRPTVERTHVGFMGCHGALNGLRVANAYATATPAARVLLCAVELCSLHFHCGDDADKAVANAIFADGAAAVVGAGPDPRGQPQEGTEDGHRFWRVAATGSCLIPDTAQAMGWAVGDEGFEMTLSRKIPGLIAKNIRPWVEGWLGGNGLSLGGVGSWAIHPGGPKILTAAAEGLGLPPDALAASRAVYAEYGNMSSPTVLFVLDHLRRAGAPRPCVALGFGPGLVAEAVLFV